MSAEPVAEEVDAEESAEINVFRQPGNKRGGRCPHCGYNTHTVH